MIEECKYCRQVHETSYDDSGLIPTKVCPKLPPNTIINWESFEALDHKVDMKKTLRKKLDIQARINPIIHQFMMMTRTGDMDFEEALLNIAVNLAEANEDLSKRVIHLITINPSINNFK